MKVHIITNNVNRVPSPPGGGIRWMRTEHPVPRNIFVFYFFSPMYRVVCKFRATFCNFFKEKCHVTN